MGAMTGLIGEDYVDRVLQGLGLDTPLADCFLADQRHFCSRIQQCVYVSPRRVQPVDKRARHGRRRVECLSIHGVDDWGFQGVPCPPSPIGTTRGWLALRRGCLGVARTRLPPLGAHLECVGLASAAHTPRRFATRAVTCSVPDLIANPADNGRGRRRPHLRLPDLRAKEVGTWRQRGILDF